MARLEWYKNVVKVGPPLTKLSGSAHALLNGYDSVRIASWKCHMIAFNLSCLQGFIWLLDDVFLLK